MSVCVLNAGSGLYLEFFLVPLSSFLGIGTGGDYEGSGAKWSRLNRSAYLYVLVHRRPLSRTALQAGRLQQTLRSTYVYSPTYMFTICPFVTSAKCGLDTYCCSHTSQFYSRSFVATVRGFILTRSFFHDGGPLLGFEAVKSRRRTESYVQPTWSTGLPFNFARLMSTPKR